MHVSRHHRYVCLDSILLTSSTHSAPKHNSKSGAAASAVLRRGGNEKPSRKRLCLRGYHGQLFRRQARQTVLLSPMVQQPVNERKS